MKSLLIFLLISIVLRRSKCSISCDFDEDFCGYQPNEYFFRYTGKSPSVSSGPYFDKTTGSEGYYALCMGKKLKNISYICRLEKNIEKIQKQLNLSFWYYQHGSQIGNLKLIINRNKTIWESSGRQKNDWLFASVILPIDTFHIEFEATRTAKGRMSSDIAIDDISVYGEIKSRIVTTTRKHVINRKLKGANFDIPNYIQGWYSAFDNYEWIQTNGNMSSFIGYQGPASDFTSISSLTRNLYDKKFSEEDFCAIPYRFEDSDGKPEFYCKKSYRSSKMLCGLKFYPKISDIQLAALCSEGYYMMITSEKYEKPSGSFRSRLISPVFKLIDDIKILFMTFSYNIHGNESDGFRLIIENYSNNEINVNLLQIQGPFVEDRWKLATLKLINLPYEQFRFIFEPFRDSSSTQYSSISLDSIDFIYGDIEIYQLTAIYDFSIQKNITNNLQSFTESDILNIYSKNDNQNRNYSLYYLLIFIFLAFVLIIILMYLFKKQKTRNFKIQKDQTESERFVKP